jgi:hypothetical protein
MQTMTLVFALLTANAAPAASPAPAASAAPTARAASGTVVIEVSFIEPSGANLANRQTRATLGTTETIQVQQGNRTVSLEATVRAGVKAGCHKIDVTLRDRRIDATGRFNKTVWQSASEPCGSAPIVLGPKEETRVQVALK